MNNFIYQGHIVRKSLGQNFLHDNDIKNIIINAINPKADEALVEIGPGLGSLTKLIATYSDYITVIECDGNLVNRLLNDSLLKSKLNVIQQDALMVNFTILSKKIGKSLRVFGNLPYNISTSLVFHLLKHITYIKDMHFMFQKEVANRLIAKPNTKNYGRLSIMIQYFCQVTPILKVSACSFTPQPKVDSTVLRIIPYSISPFPVCNIFNLEKITKIAFNQRRKILCNSLGVLFNEKQLLQQGINTKLRAENITIEQYCHLANKLLNI